MSEKSISIHILYIYRRKKPCDRGLWHSHVARRLKASLTCTGERETELTRKGCKLWFETRQESSKCSEDNQIV